MILFGLSAISLTLASASSTHTSLEKRLTFELSAPPDTRQAVDIIECTMRIQRRRESVFANHITLTSIDLSIFEIANVDVDGKHYGNISLEWSGPPASLTKEAWHRFNRSREAVADNADRLAQFERQVRDGDFGEFFKNNWLSYTTTRFDGYENYSFNFTIAENIYTEIEERNDLAAMISDYIEKNCNKAENG
ncbi:MAG: hypothetical protein ACFBWO_14200 [Paracoccaceae bacterium]